MQPEATERKLKKRKKRPWVLRLLAVLIACCCLFILWFYLVTKVNPPECRETSLTRMERVMLPDGSLQQGKSILRRNSLGIYELYLEGNPYEIGYAHGALTQELNAFQERAFVQQLRKLVPSLWVINRLKYFIGFFNRNLDTYIPLEYQQEIYGVSRFASDSFDFIAGKYHRMLNYHAAHDIGHAIQDKNLQSGCTSFLLRGAKTEDGALLMARNFDFYAGDSFAKNKMVCFVKPDKGYPYAFVTWAGFTGVVSGMNLQGLSVTINAAKSSIPAGARTPISLLVKEILQYASNLEEAKAIAAKRQTFVSESILIASARDQSGIVIEKSPDQTGILKMEGNALICVNHFQSEVFRKDVSNLKNIAESSSEYRRLRVTELIKDRNRLTPGDAAAILRNTKGLKNSDIGLGNEKTLNQLICHHAVVMQPEKLHLYVSSNPYNLGAFAAYNLKEVFETGLRIPVNYPFLIQKDSFLQSQSYAQFIRFRQIVLQLEEADHFEANLAADCVRHNPSYYHAYVLAADYCFRFGKFAKALYYYKNAALKEIATAKERREIERKIKTCRDKIAG